MSELESIRIHPYNAGQQKCDTPRLVYGTADGERPNANDSHPRARLKLGLTPEREDRLPFVLRRARHGEKIEDGRPDVLGSKAVLHGAGPKLRTEPNQ